ncbi:Glutamyl-tRNA(Gln) amidotransferase subunit A [compost metagenome]
MLDDKWNSIFSRIAAEPHSGGNLDGMSFVVKDVFGIAGYTNGAGNPDWLKTSRPSEQHSEAVLRLLAAGARLEGTTHTDELMFSLNGENYHYGTPVNPKTPDRIPGGSSSGSAVAVAAGLADFALGTDTAGSVRVPSSYCGIYGMRPTHGAVSLEGVIPLAPSFDTAGWMARDTDTLLKVGSALLPATGEPMSRLGGFGFNHILIGDDAWALAKPEVRQVLIPTLNLIKETTIRHTELVVAPEGLPSWMSVFRTIQGYEIWREHGNWIEQTSPNFGPDIAERFAWASTVREEDFLKQLELRLQIREYMSGLLGRDGLLVIPTSPGEAPLLHSSGSELEERRVRTMRLSCIAGLAGLPQLTIPAVTLNSCPLGLSVIAGPHQDMRLLAWAKQFTLSAAVQ